MGLFSTKKTIKVASTVYNLAGPEEDRPNFLKSSMFSNVMRNSDGKRGLGEDIVGNYLNGPGIDQRSFFNYCLRNNFSGLPDVKTTKALRIDPRNILPHITTPAGMKTFVREASTTNGDFTPFVDEYILATYPELFDTEYVSEYSIKDHTFTIQYESGSTEVISAGSFNPLKTYIVAYYDHVVDEVLSAEVVDTALTTTTDVGTLPSLTDYVLKDTIPEPAFAFDITDLVRKTVSYSDGTPSVVTETPNQYFRGYTGFEKVYEKTEYLGNSDGLSLSTSENIYTLKIKELRELVYDFRLVSTEVETIDGVDVTTKYVSKEGHLEPKYEYEITYVTKTTETINNHTEIFIYEVGGANIPLNSLVLEENLPTNDYFPVLPIRINNRSISDSVYSEATGNGLYEEVKKAYKKATKGSFSELIDKVEDNPSLGEIDYASVHFGVSLNTEEKSCRKYLYNYFKYLIALQNYSKFNPEDFEFDIQDYDNYIQDLIDWSVGQDNIYSPLYRAPKPTFVDMVKEPKVNSVQLRSKNPSVAFSNIVISWIDIDEEVLSGVGKPDALPDDIWIENAGYHTWKTLRLGGESGDRPIPVNNFADITKIYWQISANSYKVITLTGLQHRNYVYGATSVLIGSNEALADNDESGFIIPLHYPTMRQMSLVDVTQMSTADAFIVFNSYKVFKQRWYEKGIFKILLVIAVIVVAWYIAPASLAGASGILGGNVAVGAALGFTGSTAILAGAIANALASIVVSMIVQRGATEIFGAKWGAIIGAITSFAIGSITAGGGFSNFNFSELLSPKNLLGMSSALANGYSGYVQALAIEIGDKMEANNEEFDERMEDIQKMINALGGANDLSFDPLSLTDIGAGNGQSFSGSYVPETVDEFIHRTTLTGSDIVEVTLSLITDYADLNLTLPE